MNLFKKTLILVAFVIPLLTACGGGGGGTASTTWYEDADTDGFGNPASTVIGDKPDNTYVTDNTDCDDSNAAINPLAIEVANSIDDDCDGEIDEDIPYSQSVTFTGNPSDFIAAEHKYVSSTGSPCNIYVSFDSDAFYVGIESSAILSGASGAGNQFAHVVLSNSADLSVGRNDTQDALINYANSKSMTHYVAERIDGANVTGKNISTSGTWEAWSPTGVTTFRSAGFVEFKIPFSDIGNPTDISIVPYLVDYSTSYVYCTNPGTTDGNSPVIVNNYLRISTTQSTYPNDVSNFKLF